ncbi:MAG: hypothetical protein ACQERD_09415 [Campylobacterota bacterium]
MSEEKEDRGLKLNQEYMDVLVANVIPTTKYFESRFDHMQYQIDEIKNSQVAMQSSMDRRFEKVDERFDSMQSEMDKRFEKVDERFDSMQSEMDKRFEKVDERFDSMQSDMDKRFDSMQSDMDKRFEKVDERFKQVDKRFEQVENSINNLALKIEKLTNAQETTIRDYIIERDRFYDKKFTNLRMYNIAIIALVSGVILKMAGIIQI